MRSAGSPQALQRRRKCAMRLLDEGREPHEVASMLKVDRRSVLRWRVAWRKGVLTIGFTKKSAREFFELLRESGSKRVVDVRLDNASQLASFAKKATLHGSWIVFAALGICICHSIKGYWLIPRPWKQNSAGNQCR